MAENPRIGGASSALAKVGRGAQTRVATNQPASARNQSFIRELPSGSTTQPVGVPPDIAAPPGVPSAPPAPGVDLAAALAQIANESATPEVREAQEIFRAIAGGDFTQSDAFQQAVIQPVLANLADAGVGRSGVVGSEVAKAIIPFVLQAAGGLAETSLGAQDQQLQALGAENTIANNLLTQLGQFGGLQQQTEQAGVDQLLGLAQQVLLGPLTQTLLPGSFGSTTSIPTGTTFGIPGVFGAQK